MSATCNIPLGKCSQYDTTVSQCDYAALTAYRWNYKISAWQYGAKVYARRGGGQNRDGTPRPTIYMARVILEELIGEPAPTLLHTPHHIDGNSLNNTRDNLEWATKSKQSAEQKPRMDHRIRKAIEQARATA
jgi:hypothetical protein